MQIFHLWNKNFISINFYIKKCCTRLTLLYQWLIKLGIYLVNSNMTYSYPANMWQVSCQFTAALTLLDEAAHLVEGLGWLGRFLRLRFCTLHLHSVFTTEVLIDETLLTASGRQTRLKNRPDSSLLRIGIGFLISVIWARKIPAWCNIL